MYGAIIGDIAGSIYEYEQIKKIKHIKINGDLINNKGFFSDESILTVALLDAVLNKGDYKEYVKLYGKRFIDYKPDFEPYFKTSFSPGFIKWIKEDFEGSSIGNGAMMRISPIGYLFNTEEEVVENVVKATIPSHNSEEAINCATTVSLIIFLSRKGLSKEEIINKLNLDFQYKDFSKFNSTCYETIDNCLYALFTSNSFDESIRKVISYGGDTDTNACIVGSMAEALYGIDDDLILQAKEKLPERFIKILDEAYSKIQNL